MKKEYDNHKFRRMPLLFVMTGIMMMLAGCGQDEAVSADAQTQETVADTADSTGTGTIPEASGDAADGTGTASAVDRQNDIEPTQVNTGEQHTKMDEETRQQLTAELLEENELDMSVVESGRTTRDCTFELPEGFEESQEVDGLYVTSRYPLDASMIYYAVMEQDTSMQLMTEELFKEQAEENLKLAYDEDIEVNIDSFESVNISGYPAFRILCHYQADGIEITQLEYAVNADKSYTVIYSQTNDYDWMEAYEASAATIKVK